jgi:hypothetical protein
MNQLLEKLEFLARKILSRKKYVVRMCDGRSKIYFFAGVWRLIAEVFSARDGTQFAQLAAAWLCADGILLWRIDSKATSSRYVHLWRCPPLPRRSSGHFPGWFIAQHRVC